MGPDLHVPDTHLRCPACSGAVRPDAPWCTQCWHDMRPAVTPPPAQEALPVPSPPAAPSSSPAAPTGPVVEGPAAPAPPTDTDAVWPCSTCGASNGLDRDACAACGAGFLAALKGTEEPLLVLPVVGDLGALSRAQRLGLAAGVVLAVVVLVLVLGLLLS